MDYIIEKSGIEPQYVEAQPEQVFQIKYVKTALDVEGNEVEVIDENRVERVTVAQLESQKASLQAQIKEIDSKLAQISVIK